MLSYWVRVIGIRRLPVRTAMAMVSEVDFMIDKDDKMDPEVTGAISGLEARRKFLRSTGRAAIAAPAVALLLSAASTGAVAQTQYGNNPTVPIDFANPRKKNILDP